MLNKESIYQSSLPKVDENSIIVAPHQLLRPYIATYMFTNPSTMPDQQTILPTISSPWFARFKTVSSLQDCEVSILDLQ